ncbi:adhesion G protein-coupled receptor F5 [Siphateles boraxobius]|uniref:adhesion G protein-coupled receptor F5 n=1 Tax=Siphateles boraxobius TaxID=180520 RepID=UPI0040638E3C
MLSGFTSQREIDGTKMKLSKGIILIFLALIFKVAVAENSTKVYLLELEFENLVYNHFTDHLGKLKQIDVNRTAIVTEITSTTDCTLNKSQKNCSCMTNYTWSEDIFKKYACCKGENCMIKEYDTAVCLYEKRVSINGTTTLTNGTYYDILRDSNKKQEDEYTEKEKQVITMLKTHFSTLKYFDSLIINGYRYGSVIVDYTVQLLGSVTSEELEKVTGPLNNSELTTTGLVTILVPQEKPIDIGSSANINCTPSEPLGHVQWYLTNVKNKTTEITEGNEAQLTSNRMDILNLMDISGSWKGTITCMYTKGSIKHTASKQLDVALLPEIQAMSNPQFPNCKDPKKTPTVKIEIECSIIDNNENYSVTWNTNLPGLSKKDPEIQDNRISYKAEATIVCANKEETVDVNCTFTNYRSPSNKTRMNNVQIPIILPLSTYCQGEDVWPNTKSNYTASMNCMKAVGLKTRACNGIKWGQEISSCVDEDLHGIQTDIEEFNKGIGFIKDDAKGIFARLKGSTASDTFNAYANINASVNIFDLMNNISQRQLNFWNDTVLPDLVSSLSNVLNDIKAWNNPENNKTNLSVIYLQTIEKMVVITNLSSDVLHESDNVKLQLCNGNCSFFGASVDAGNGVKVVGLRNIHQILPQPELQENATSETTILSVTAVNNTNLTQVVLKFEYSKNRLPNHYMYCVFWDENKTEWSDEGCKWGGVNDPELCTCDHNSAFTILMAKNEVTLPYMEELTYIGLGISIISLVLCLIIEILIWDTVVKSDISNFRHVAMFNICLCLLIAHCGFLASANPKILGNWCSILTVVKHLFFLAVFFWMLCLSFVILHQIIFVFDHLRKKVFWGLSITLGYVCPILCVAVTFIAFENGKAEVYYSTKTCWLVYKGTLKGSLYAFILPVGTIVFINLFTLVVVIMKIVTPTVSEAKARDEKDVAKSMIKTIVFLSPVLGITWIFGFFIMDLDLTETPWAQIVNYTFTVLNSLQGFFILLTNCVGEKKVRDALRKRFRGSKQSAHSKSESSTKATYSVKNK